MLSSGNCLEAISLTSRVFTAPCPGGDKEKMVSFIPFLRALLFLILYALFLLLDWHAYAISASQSLASSTMVLSLNVYELRSISVACNYNTYNEISKNEIRSRYCYSVIHLLYLYRQMETVQALTCFFEHLRFTTSNINDSNITTIKWCADNRMFCVEFLLSENTVL